MFSIKVLKMPLYNNSIRKMFSDQLKQMPSTTLLSVANSMTSSSKIENLDTNEQLDIDWPIQMQQIEKEESKSLLEPVNNEHAFDSVAPFLKPTFNLASYVNKSETLQELIKLGVDLNKIDRKELGKFVLKLDFEKNVKDHIMFLNKIGIDPDVYGVIITKNPLIFKQNLDHLQTRINYLQSKLFKPTEIARIVQYNPYWLMYSTQRIDARLGFFQRTFDLTGNEVRYLTVKQPKIITYNLESIRENSFSIKEELGFDKIETKELLLKSPKIWMLNRDTILDRFDYVHRRLNISHSQILQFSEVMYCRRFKLKQRNEFLRYLKKAQYDPSKELYISLKQLIEGTENEFVLNVAKSSLTTYDTFLRQL